MGMCVCVGVKVVCAIHNLPIHHRYNLFPSRLMIRDRDIDLEWRQSLL